MSLLPIGETLVSSDEFFPIRVGCVYVLVDADDPDHVRYIGSTWEARGRFSNHVFSGVGGKVKAWVDEVRAKGGRILMRCVARDSDRNALYRIEQDQLDEYLAIGQCDLNGLYTRPAHTPLVNG